MPTVRISKRTVDALCPSDKPLIVYDAELKGFGCRVMPSGVKSYVVEYRPGAGGRGVAKKRMTFGSTKTLTPDQARDIARDTLARVRLGEDPAAARQSSRDMPTVAQFAETFLEEACRPPNIKPRTKALYADNLRRLALPHLGSMKLDAVTSADIARLHRKIGKDTPTAANNLVVTLSSLWRFAEETGTVAKAANPVCGAVQRFKVKPRERFLTAEETSRLAEALNEAETVGLPWHLKSDAEPSKAKHRARPENQRVVVSTFVTAAIRLLLFTGCRRSEILNLRWSEFDFECGMLHLQDSKTGKKTVMLNAPALAVIAGLPRLGAFVIAGRDETKARTDVSKAWYRIRAHAGLDGADGKQPFRLHDCRHSFASFGVAGGMGLPIVGKLLGHSQASTTHRYAHLDADPLRRAVDTIGETISAAMDGGKGGEVVGLPKVRGK
jgi:integrase